MNKFLLDIGTKKFEVIKGGTEGPIVVIETGMGVSMYDWLGVIDALEKTATVISYHRSGYGQSSTFDGDKRSISDFTNDLYLLMKHMNISEPIILVAHSFGGVCAQHFAIQHPDIIRGMVLVDASPTDYSKIEQLKAQLPKIYERYNSSIVIERFSGFALKSREELRELFKPQLMPEQENLPANFIEGILDFGINPKLYETMVNELDNLINSKLTTEELNKFPQIQLRVLVRDKTIEINKLVDVGIPYSEAEKLEDLVQTLMREQTNLSKKSELVEVEQCGHAIYRENPEIVICAIQQVIRESNQ